MPGKKKLIYINNMPHKECTKCKGIMPLDDYHPRGIYKDGTQAYKSACIYCNGKDGLDRYYRKMKESPLGRRQATYRYTIKSCYKLSELNYNKIYDSQDGKCLICEDLLQNIFTNTKGKASSVDHCHSTYKIRGILCKMCNSGIGMLGDSKENIHKALNYLEKFDESLCL